MSSHRRNIALRRVRSCVGAAHTHPPPPCPSGPLQRDRRKPWRLSAVGASSRGRRPSPWHWRPFAMGRNISTFWVVLLLGVCFTQTNQQTEHRQTSVCIVGVCPPTGQVPFSSFFNKGWAIVLVVWGGGLAVSGQSWGKAEQAPFLSFFRLGSGTHCLGCTSGHPWRKVC